jgi:hypothetical protein
MIGEAGNPVHTKIVGDGGIGKVIAVTVISLAPVAIAILAQNPALRQSLELRAWSYMRLLAARNVRAWQKLEAMAQARYELARL